MLPCFATIITLVENLGLNEAKRNLELDVEVPIQRER